MAITVVITVCLIPVMMSIHFIQIPYYLSVVLAFALVLFHLRLFLRSEFQ
jgi:hypothetical protein